MTPSPKEDSFSAWSKLVLPGIVIVLFTGAASTILVNSLSIGGRPTRDEVTKMINDLAPYTKDKTAIFHRLDQSNTHNIALLSAVKENTNQIQSMRIQIERLLVVKPADIYQKMEDLERLIKDSGIKMLE